MTKKKVVRNFWRWYGIFFGKTWDFYGKSRIFSRNL